MKFFFAGFILSLTLINYSFSQNPTPNAGFEDWTIITIPTQYEVPDGWDQLNEETNFIGILTCVKSTDAHSGSFAAKLITKVVTIATIVDTANGIISTGKLITVPPYGVIGGLPYNLRPDSIAGWIKYAPTPGDSCQIQLDLRGATNDTIGKALFKTGATISQYTRFSAPVIYSSPLDPDTALWLISSSNGFNSLPNSTLYIDDISLIFVTGIPETPTVSAMSLSSNLVQDELVIRNNKNLSGVFNLYDTSGRVVMRKEIAKALEVLDVSALTNGFYFYHAVDDTGHSLCNGTAAIQH